MSMFGDAELFEEFETRSHESGQSGGSLGTESDSDQETQRDEKYKKVLAENEELKKTLRLLERPANIKVKDASKDGPVAHVILFNNHLSRKFKGEIEDFFCQLCTREGTDSDELRDIKPPFIQYLSPRHEKTHKRSSKRAEATTKAFQGFSSIQMYDKFLIDQLGQPLYFEDPAHSNWILPLYEPVEFEPLSGDFDSAVRLRKRVQRICFNCGGTDHQIKDCEKPRDHQAINERRQKFLKDVARYSQGSPQIRLDGHRYHKDDDAAEDDKEKFAKFKPGMISTELQEALGMKEDDLPPYVYQMRRLGYPPGHLHTAKILNSGLLLYEEGEINGRIQDNEYTPVDVEKIIGYPGFNLPPLPGQQDKFKEHSVYPINPQQSKEIMVSYFEHRNALYNQQKASEDQNRKDKERDTRTDVVIQEVDMEVGDDEAGVEMHISNSDDEEAHSEDGEVEQPAVPGMEIVADVGDLSQDELEVKRELLLKALRQSSERNNDSDYRNIKSNDQDYRIMQSGLHEIATEDTPQSPESHNEETSTQDTVVTFEEIIDLTVEDNEQDIPEGVKKRELSSDTDYRMPPSFEGERAVLKNENPAESSSQSLLESQPIEGKLVDTDQRLPGTSFEGERAFLKNERPAESSSQSLLESQPIEGKLVDTDQRLPGTSFEVERAVLKNEGHAESSSQSIEGKLVDTDQRLPGTSFEVERAVLKKESPAESSSQSLLESQPVEGKPVDTDQRLPGRHKFAEGISKFDMYYSESKSRGVYDKLRLLLKDSPRRQEK